MKRILSPLIALFLAVVACGFPPAATPTELPIITEPPVVTGPTVTVTTAPPDNPEPTVTVTTAPPGPQVNVTCSKLSLYLDPALASSYSCETIPAITEGPVVYPEHTLLTLQGYPLSGKRLDPQIAIFSISAYTSLLPDYLPSSLTTLQTLSAGGPAPTFSGSFGTSLPLLPSLNAGQVFFAHYQGLPFQSGSGIRYLTEYAQFYDPVNNYDMFYTFQGLTSDGQSWVSVILPVNHPLLIADGNNPPDGMSWDQFGNQFDTYITDMVNQLNSWSPDSFTPALAALDALASSITIQP